jgi:hypothetical protein
MQSTPQFKFSSNIYSQNAKDPRNGISQTSANNLDVALYWESMQKESLRPTTSVQSRDHLKEMWTMPENKRSSQSKYREVYKNSDELAQIISDSDKTHHKKKDWLKSFFESLHKNKHFNR